MTKIRSLALSWDTGAAVVVLVMFYFWHPTISVGIAKDVFGVGLSVLAIIFSVFFAALAVLMSSGDDAFVEFLMKNKFYEGIMWVFHVTLGALFVALFVSIALFIQVLPAAQDDMTAPYSLSVFALYCAFVAYSLMSAYLATKLAIKYTDQRRSYMLAISPADRGAVPPVNDPSANRTPSADHVSPASPSDRDT